MAYKALKEWQREEAAKELTRMRVMRDNKNREFKEQKEHGSEDGAEVARYLVFYYNALITGYRRALKMICDD